MCYAYSIDRKRKSWHGRECLAQGYTAKTKTKSLAWEVKLQNQPFKLLPCFLAEIFLPNEQLISSVLDT